MRDARQLADGEVLECDVCIVGAGPVGISITRQFVDSDLKVIHLESGGIMLGDHADDLSEPASEGPYGTTSFITNVRHYGGNSNAWNIIRNDGIMGVRFATFQDVDFETRPGIPDSGWPIKPADIAPYIKRAASLWELAPDGFKPGEEFTTDTVKKIQAKATLETSMFQFPDAALARIEFRKVIDAAPNIETLYHATATQIIPNAGDTGAEAVIIKPSAKKEAKIKAKAVIISASGMGSCQLLLSSPTKAGHEFGNQGGALGRYIIDHPLVSGGDIILNNRTDLDDMLLYDIDHRRGASSMGYLHLSKDLVMREEIPNLNMMLFPRGAGHKQASAKLQMHQRAHQSAVRTRNALRRRQIPALKDVFYTAIGMPLILGDIIRLYTDPQINPGRGGWDKKGLPSKRFDRLEVVHSVEQLPHRDNRMYLSEETNRLGLRRITFDYQIHDSDYAAFKRFQDVMGKAVAEAGFGTFKPYRDKDDNIDMVSMSCGHHMGMTRMGADPATSVTDGDCRVHGTDNLYVACSGLYPTGGSANPTFLAISLGIRIADRLKASL